MIPYRRRNPLGLRPEGRALLSRLRVAHVSGLPSVAAAALSAAAMLLCAPSAYSAVTGGEGKGKPDTPVLISSDTMEAVRAERLVVFRGDVVAEEDFLVCSDELRITYGEDNAVTDITARGNVRLFHSSRSGTSDVAVYDRKNRSLVMTGNPVVEQCSDMVKGSRITVYLDSDRAVVESEGTGRVSAVIMPEKKCDDTGLVEARPEGQGRCRRSR